MHASVLERRAPGEVCGMTQQRSGGRWQAVDGGLGAGNDGSVIPRQAPRHEAAPSTPDHEDTLIYMDKLAGGYMGLGRQSEAVQLLEDVVPYSQLIA